MAGGLAVNGARARRSEIATWRKNIGTLGEAFGVLGLVSSLQAISFLEESRWIVVAMAATGTVAWAWAAFGKKETTPSRASALMTGCVVFAAIALSLFSLRQLTGSLLTTTTTEDAAVWEHDGIGYRARITSSRSFKHDGVTVSVGRRFLFWTYANEDIMGCWSGYGTVRVPKVRYVAPGTILVYDAGSCAEYAWGKVSPRVERNSGFGLTSYDGMGVVFQK